MAIAAVVLVAIGSGCSSHDEPSKRACSVLSEKMVDRLVGGGDYTAGGTLHVTKGSGECTIASGGDTYLVATVKDLPTKADVERLHVMLGGERAAVKQRCDEATLLDEPGYGYTCVDDGEVNVGIVTKRQLIRLILPSKGSPPTVKMGLDIARVIAGKSATG